jgi:CBS domain-containing protein
MKVSELMTVGAACCCPRTNLAQATEMLCNSGCGALPVVDDKKRVIGIVTDRDMCIALGTRNRQPSDLFVEDVMTKNVFTCSPDEDVKRALAVMQTCMVRRLPIVGPDKTLRGVLSLSSIVRHASPSGDLSHANVMDVLKRLSEGRMDDRARKTTHAEATQHTAKAEPVLHAVR